ncbi:acyl-CoA dehydrogenase family protein [Singulisphaera acidiphila]|uniref:Acyl-CoA dehydrogenase n=1 Tax=Singulisphaera acidiphila (strain ATCC BAA-1392 / DSM 18658 / VKM B-2454 / MOB10) TaxID=886293 RepID=L0DAT8_SINAD|nr:acyl-CoA dehydrogenase family protein [Singulisphaera acidiphila]AGA25965.1 acyl-CoA dehydrogenase [Singulisphaera acidiphila DSM 18658]
MDFSLSAEQQDWQDRAIAFAKENLVDDLLGRDERREFWREGWQRCARFGIQGLPIPAEYGGKGQDLQATIAAMEGLGYGCADNGLIFAINASMWTNSIPILRYGTEAQKRQFLPSLCDGTFVGANGASEVDAGSDIFSMQTRAERRGDRWILNGRKVWVTSGPVADLFVCYATSAPERGVMGISAFIIPRETPGFRVVREIPKLGVRTVPMGELALEDCELPLESLLGREGRGAEVFNCSMEWERGAILAGSLGTMKRQLERCITHVRTRKQFGKPIGKNQSVANKIVDMAVRLETCRPLVYRIGWLKAKGKDATLEAAMAKLHVSDCYVKNSLDAVQLFGAAGYVSETGIEKDLRDSIGSTIYSGTNEIQRNVIAQHLIR